MAFPLHNEEPLYLVTSDPQLKKYLGIGVIEVAHLTTPVSN